MLSRTTNRLVGSGIRYRHHRVVTSSLLRPRIERLSSSSSGCSSSTMNIVYRRMMARSNNCNRSRAASAMARSSTTTAAATTTTLNDNGYYSNGNRAYAMLLGTTTTLAAMSLALLSSTTNNSPTHLEEAPTTNTNDEEDDEDEEDDSKTTILNWSGTHTITPTVYHEPETIPQLQQIVAHAHTHSLPLRPSGSALSPNGISFAAGMISLSNLDAVLHVDTTPGRSSVRVQAGARVSQVIDELRPYGLTLPNLASIAEQQMGGFTQIGAHGTGASIGPIDSYVTELTLITPAEGRVVLRPDDPDGGKMFRLARVGLGCLGIVADVTVSCVPDHRLMEHTYTLTRAEARANLPGLLKSHRHVRYMWIPYEDTVIVVTNDVENAESAAIVANAAGRKATWNARFAPLRDRLVELTRDAEEPYTSENLQGKGFGALRDALIAVNPLDVDHMKVVNKAEAEFWKGSEGYRLRPSDELLQFDCGGQQWVYEVCLPTGTYEQNDGNDMKFMEELLSSIEREQIPAHPPIEQRWSASSTSDMSPAYGKAGEGGLFCWVGIIMYLPDEGESIRRDITSRFQNQYCDLAKTIGVPFQTISHWGKLEMPTSPADYERLRSSMIRRYPVEEFNAARVRFDPKNILGNRLINTVLGTPDPKLIFPRR